MDRPLVAAGRPVGRFGIFGKIQYGAVFPGAGDLIFCHAGKAVQYLGRRIDQRNHRPDRLQPGHDLEFPARLDLFSVSIAAWLFQLSSLPLSESINTMASPTALESDPSTT